MGRPQAKETMGLVASYDTVDAIIKVFLNPLVAWIWIGVFVVILGTATALTPNLQAALSASRVKAAIPQDAAIAGSGD